MKLIEKVKNWLNQDHNALKVAVLALIAIGTLLIYTVGPFAAARIQQDPNFFFNKYVPFLPVALGILAVGSMLSKKWILRISRVWLFIGCGLILMTLLDPHVIRGSARYVTLLGWGIDPFVMTMPAYIVMMSHWLSKERTKKSQRAWTSTWITALTVAIIFAAMVAPYTMMALLYLAIFVIMTYKTRKNMPGLSKISIVTALAMAALLVYAFLKLDTVAGHIHYLLYENFASNMSKAAICYHSTFIGPKAGQLAELLRPGIIDPISDFAFTSIIAWYGYFAAAALLALYYWTARRLKRNIKTTQDPFFALLNTGTLALVLLYLFFSLTTAFGVLPTASYLPLVSYSPMRLIAFSALFGFIFSEKAK